MTQKINFPTNRKGYDKSETTVGKLSSSRIWFCRVYFCLVKFWPSKFQKRLKQGPHKNRHGTVEFASSKNPIQRSPILRRCLGSMGNWFWNNWDSSSIGSQNRVNRAQSSRIERSHNGYIQVKTSTDEQVQRNSREFLWTRSHELAFRRYARAMTKYQ